MNMRNEWRMSGDDPTGKVVEDILSRMEASPFMFDGLDPSQARRFVRQRAHKILDGTINPQDMADVLVKFLYMVKHHSKSLALWHQNPFLHRHTFDLLHEFVNHQYYQFKAFKDRRIQAKAMRMTDEEFGRLAAEGAEAVIETPRHIVRRITTMEAAILHGKATSWCISNQDPARNAWNEYSGWIHHFIEDKSYYDTEKDAPSGTKSSQILASYPKRHRPVHARIVVSLDKASGTLTRTIPATEISPKCVMPTNENQDINDKRITNKDLFEILEGWEDKEIYEHFDKLRGAV